MKLVSSSLLQDLLDTVERAAHLQSISSMTFDFSGTTLSGTYPAAVMGIANSGLLLHEYCKAKALLSRC